MFSLSLLEDGQQHFEASADEWKILHVFALISSAEVPYFVLICPFCNEIHRRWCFGLIFSLPIALNCKPSPLQTSGEETSAKAPSVCIPSILYNLATVQWGQM